MHTNLRNFIKFLLLGGMLVALLGGLIYANYRFASEYDGGHDFISRWMGARYWLVHGVSPYDPSVSLASQREIYGRPTEELRIRDKAQFLYPLNSMLFFGGFGLLEYMPAWVLWMTIIELSLIGVVTLGVRVVGWETSLLKRAVLVLFALFWYYGLRTIVAGQFAALNAFLITAVFFFILSKQDYASGLLLSLALAKPQMVFLLLPFILLWAASKRRWEIWWGTITGVFIQVGLTMLLLPEWPRQMIMQWLDTFGSISEIGSPLAMIAGAAPGLFDQINNAIHVAFMIYMIFEWYIAWGKDERHFLWAGLLTITITNLVAYLPATSNYVVLVLALLFIFRMLEERWRLPGRILTWATLVGLTIGIWAWFLNTQGNQEQPMLYIVFPFFILIGLWWVRWWATRPESLLFQLKHDRLRV